MLLDLLQFRHNREMHDGHDAYSPSLYRILGKAVSGTGPDRDSGTQHTTSFETIDDDHAADALASFGLGNEPGFGTELTRTIETLDNDHAVAAIAALDLGYEPGPGTAMTHAIETIDNDHAADLLALSSLSSVM